MSKAEFTLEIEGFKGPLELLLDLIEQRKLDVNDVSLAQVSDDYITYIEDRSRVPLSETAQFVVVASTLLLIKSRSLLPALELTTQEEEDIRDLETRLRLYAETRHAAKLLRQNWGKRGYLPRHVPTREVSFAPAADITPVYLAQAVKKLIDSLPSFTKAPTARIAREIKLDDVIESLSTRMRSAFKDSFKRVTSGAERVEAIVNFLALLELVKRGTLSVEQHKNFSDITMHHDAIDTPHYAPAQ